MLKLMNNLYFEEVLRLEREIAEDTITLKEKEKQIVAGELIWFGRKQFKEELVKKITKLCELKNIKWYKRITYKG